MADPTTAIKKKLPFKPTALRNARPKPTPTSSTEDDLLQASARHHGVERNNGREEEEEEDTLALFRRAKEMAPIVEADRERRLRRQLQKQREQEEAERRRVSAGSKHSLGEGEGSGGDATTPTATQDEDTIMATQEEDNRELVTTPPSKRSRRDTSASSTKHKDVDLEAATTTSSAPDSPTMRAMRSLGPDRSMTPALYNTSLYSNSSGAGPATTSKYNTRAQARQGPPPGSQVISLDDSDSEPEMVAPAPPVEIIDQALTLDLDLNADAPEDDDEFAEYVRRAQEQRDKHLLQKEEEAAAALSAEGPSLTPAAAAAAAAPSLASSPAPDKAKQIIDIVITSEVPNTRMCLVKFRFDRPLRVVRDSWTALQHRHNVPLRGLLDRDDDVILTWRRKKVYMVSTLLSLGIRPSDAGDGSAVVEGYSREGFNESRTRVHMQAWTPALFADMERAEEEERRRREASQEANDVGGTQGTQASASEHEGGEAAEAAAEVTKLRIILKSRDMEAVKLKVMPETTTETLVAAFRAQRDIPEGADVGLWFDGMRLEDGATMEDAEIDDMDTIEVHVK